ncbi:MAG TPA: cysteine dioxygenase family protein [Acidimicrobiales bacterium]
MAAVDTDLEPATGPAPAEPLDHAVLVDIACGIAEARSLWEPHVVHDERDRRPVRLLATDAYEVWVIGWTEGQGVDMHDHAGSAGVLVVADGALTERRPGFETERLGAGAVQRLDRTVVHEVANVEVNPATSIHVYSPPLLAMGYYDEHGERALLIENVVEEAPVVDRRATARALHPALRGA